MQVATSGGARACFRGAAPPSAATTGALRAQDARGSGRLQHLTRGGRLSLCAALGELPLAAGRWRGYPEGPRDTRRPRTPAATGTYRARCRQKARVRSGWTPGCRAGREMCRPGGHATVVCREAPHPLWTHPSTVFPRSRAPPSGKPGKEQSKTSCSPGGWAGAPHLGADGGGAPRGAGHALPPGAPVYLL